MIKADYFKETVLKIESDNISAVEVALHLDELRGNIMLRKEEQYLSPEIENEKQNLIANCEFDEAIIHKVINTFFGNCKSNIIHIFITELRDLFFFSDDANEYLSLWSEQFDEIRDFSWVVLRTMPIWSEINKTMQQFSNLADDFELSKNSPKVFSQYGYIKTFASPEKFEEWNTKKLTTEARWVEIFKHMEAQHVPYLEISRLIEFLLCLPGTSAPVERVFSLAKNIWKIESSALQIETLKSILLVKMNLDYSCVDFYNFLKTQPQLLRRIACQEKYDFKEHLQTRSEASDTSKMSIECGNPDHIEAEIV